MGRNPASTFLQRLVGSKLARVALGYPVVAWVVLQVGEIVVPELSLPDWTLRLLIVMALLGYPIALLLAWAAMRSPATASTVAPPASGTIAVLPFADMSPDSDHAWFCEGIAEEVINDLVKVASLKVVARTSSFSFRNSELDARQIGRELGVSSILEGSVRKAGDRVRINAQLIDVSNGYHLWSQRYDRDMCDVFAVQDEISRSIVEALRVAITPEEQRAMALPKHCSVEAWEHYLKGRHQFHRFGRRGLEAARRWFERALEECDTFAPAYAGMADCLSQIYLYLDARKEYREQAVSYAERALELDPQSAEAHVAMGFASTIMQDTASAEASFRRALELDPDSFEAHYQYGRMLWTADRQPLSLQHMQRAVEVKPDDYQAAGLLVGMLRGAGHEKEQLKYAEITVERALAHLPNEPDDVRAMYLLSGALAVLGRKDEAREWAERAIAVSPTTETYYNTACTYASLGDVQRALDLLERSDMQGSNYQWVVRDPDLDPLRDEPRFHAIVERLKKIYSANET